MQSSDASLSRACANSIAMSREFGPSVPSAVGQVARFARKGGWAPGRAYRVLIDQVHYGPTIAFIGVVDVMARSDQAGDYVASLLSFRR